MLYLVNKKYKDRLFRMIFGYEKYKGNLLSLYNALNDTEYTNPDELEITTIEDAIWMGMKILENRYMKMKKY